MGLIGREIERAMLGKIGQMQQRRADDQHRRTRAASPRGQGGEEMGTAQLHQHDSGLRCANRPDSIGVGCL